jgi:hypothetical protein
MATWLLKRCDSKSRYVGKLGSGGIIVPYSLAEIAAELRRPGEDALPLWTVCRLISHFRAAFYIHRHQERELERDQGTGEEHWKGKVAILRVTLHFLRDSRCSALHEHHLRKLERKNRRGERFRGEIGALTHTIANGRSEDPRERYRRDVRAEHADWSDWAVEQEAGQRLKRSARPRVAPT